MISKCIQFLESEGFQETNPLAAFPHEKFRKSFIKRIKEDVLFCTSNDKPPLIQVNVTQIRVHGDVAEYYEASITGERRLAWYTVSATNSLNTLIADYPTIYKNLISSWNALI